MDTLERLVAALENLEKGSAEKSLHTKAPANNNTASLLTQPNGMFAISGMESDVISLHLSPMGLGANIPAISSNVDDPRFGFLTGFSDDIGSEATAPCGDAPTGYMKAGTLTARFGRVMRQTNTIEIDKLLHMKRGVNTDLRLMNNVLNGAVGLDMANMDQGQLLDLVVKTEMVGLGVRMERKLAKMLWAGAITNDTVGGGYKEFPGLDSQIATGHVDAESNTAMASADSDIKNFNYNLVDGTTLDIVEYLSMLEFYLRHKAERTNMLPVTWAVVMRPELWFELSAVWPCRYLTHRCSIDNGSSPVVINDNVNVQMRDAMRNGNYIDINGRRYPVITDDGIFEHTNVNNANVSAGSYASSIYMVPLRVRGSFPATYWEYIDYRGVQQQLSPLGAGQRNVPFWTDNGKFLWVYRENGYCFDLQAKIEPRVILRTPHLAGKIQNVKYTPLQHLASPFADNPYWQNGGQSIRPSSTSYAVWGSFNT